MTRQSSVGSISEVGASLIGTTTASAVRDLIAAASSTTATQTIYVDKAATGAGTGVDWTNAFTTIQAAFDSLPAIINHAVEIYVRKGSTAYSDTSTLQRTVAGGSVTVRGEYYWVNQAKSNATANRLYKADADDWTGIESGDAVYLLQYSGTYEASIPTIAYVGTVDSIAGLGSGYVTVTCPVGSVTPTTGWKYVITKTVISGALTAQNMDMVTIKGLTFTNTVALTNSRNSTISECNITAPGSPYTISAKSSVSFLNSYFGNSGSTDGMGSGMVSIQCIHCFFEKLTTAGRSLLRISNTSELTTCRYTYISGRSGNTASAAILVQMNCHAYVLDTKIAYCDIGINTSYMSGCLKGGTITNGATTPEAGSGTNGCLIY